MDVASSVSRRGAVRRAVRIACSVRSDAWEGLAPFLATDLSPGGLFLCSPLALPEGERVSLTFIPPRWPETLPPVHAHARVVRASVPRRKTDRALSGMGLCFERLAADEIDQLVAALRGLPPPLPSRPAPEPREVGETVILHDGIEFELRAEAPLLTTPRARIERRAEPWPPSLGEPAPSPSGAELRRRHRSYRKRSRAALAPRHRAPSLRLVG